MADELDSTPELDTALDIAPESDVSTEVETPAKVEVAKAEPTTPKTMEESIREKYRELGAPKSDTDVNRPRDAEGKFAAKTPEVKTEVPVVDEAKLAADAAKAASAVAKVVPGLEKAPTSWKGPAQAKWDKVDPEIKAEVHRREQDFHKGLEQSKREAGLFKELDTVIQPYAAMLRAENLTPQAAIADFMNTAYLLRTGSAETKASVIAEIARNFGVDVSVLPEAAERIAAGVPVVDPKIAELENRFVTLTTAMEQEKHAAVQREYATVVAETQAFAGKNPHYEAVKLDMAALIESGRASDLQDAYNKAIWANPEVRGTLLAEQQAAQRKQAAEKAAAAKKASVTNVATRGTLPSAPAVAGTMEDTIRAKLRELNGV